MSNNMIVSNPENFREKLRERILDLFRISPHTSLFDENFGDEYEKEKMVANLEKGIFNYAIKEADKRKIVKKWENPYFVQLYTDHMRSIYTNLQANAHLTEQLFKKEILPQNLAFMTHIEMAPEQWKDLLEAKMKRDMSKNATNDVVDSEMFQCRKCKSRKIQYYELQTRSADESATVFLTCLACGKTWRIS